MLTAVFSRASLRLMPPVLAIVMLLGLVCAIPAQAQTVAYWRFEEGPLNAAATGSGTILDSSGNGLNGTPINSPIYRSTAGAVPGSTLGLQFGNTANQRVFIADNPLFALTSSLTLEAYIRLDQYPVLGTDRYSEIVFRGDNRGALDPYYLAVEPDGRLRFFIQAENNDASSMSILNSPLAIPLGTVLHVAGTLDGATGAQRLFINGLQVASTTTTVRPFATLDSSQIPGIAIGNLQDQAGGNQQFHGIIDEVRVSSAALSPSQFLNAAAPEPSTLSLLFLMLSAMGLTTRARSIRICHREARQDT